MNVLPIATVLLLFALFAPQERFPAPPADATRIYFVSDGQPKPLPFEEGMVSANVFVAAPEDKIMHVRLKGSKAATVLSGADLRFYVFVGDRMDPPPHQLVRLTPKGSNRELKISLIKGRKGYAPFDADTLKLEHRLLERLRVSAGTNRILFVNYMELRLQGNLTPGEYAIIGDSLADMATFRIP